VFIKETINCKRYVQAILGQFFSELTKEETLYVWFERDSSTARTARICMQAFSDVFEDRIISSDIWPERSPEFNPCNIFLWGCLKNKIYNSNTPNERRIKRKYQKGNCKYSCRTTSKSKSESPPLMRGVSTCRWPSF
jgi:hypothetical protein